jgi:hypothetical protein
MSGTHLFYNGILLQDCELLEFDQVIEKDKSGTDPMYSRFRITVASNLVSLLSTNPNQPPPSSITMLDEHPSTIKTKEVSDIGNLLYVIPDRVEEVRRLLGESRKDFWFAINSTTYKPEPNERKPPASKFDDKDAYRIILAATGMAYSGDSVPDPVGNLSGYYSGSDTDIPRKDVIDCNNGPKTSNIRVLKIDGGRLMRVQLTIEVCRVLVSPKPSTGGSIGAPTRPVVDAAQTTGVISNRWSIRETLDENWKTGITVEGVLVVSDHRYKPYTQRLMTSTHLIPYAKLTSREFFTSEDGLTLRYRYSMVESGEAPPEYVVDWDGTYSEKTDHSGIVLSSFGMKIKGVEKPPNRWTHQQYKAKMLDILMGMVASRITLDANNPNRLPGNNPHTKIIKDLTVIETIGKPELSISVVIQNAADPHFENLKLRLGNIGKSLSADEFAKYDHKWWPMPAAFQWDVASENAERADFGSNYDGFFQEPTSDWHGKPRGWAIGAIFARKGDRPFENSPPPIADSASTIAETFWATSDRSDPPALNRVAVDAFPFNTNNWSEDHLTKGATFISASSENLYDGHRGKMVLPLSKVRKSSFPIPDSDPLPYYESVVAIQVHAGVNTRRFNFTCTRENDWPKIPAPKDVLVSFPSASAPTGPLSPGPTVEVLLNSKIIPQSPICDKDGKTMVYSVECQFDYVLNKPPETLRVPRDPRVRPVSVIDSAGVPLANDQQLPIAYLYDFTGKIEATVGP